MLCAIIAGTALCRRLLGFWTCRRQARSNSVTSVSPVIRPEFPEQLPGTGLLATHWFSYMLGNLIE
jgi:hypothetical protein